MFFTARKRSLRQVTVDMYEVCGSNRNRGVVGGYGEMGIPACIAVPGVNPSIKIAYQGACSQGVPCSWGVSGPWGGGLLL